METTKFNETQIHLLNMFKYTKSENQLKEVKELLSKYFAEKVDKLSDKIWEEKKLSEEEMDNILNSHIIKKLVENSFRHQYTLSFGSFKVSISNHLQCAKRK